jgi:hypothetical protein
VSGAITRVAGVFIYVACMWVGEQSGGCDRLPCAKELGADRLGVRMIPLALGRVWKMVGCGRRAATERPR